MVYVKIHVLKTVILVNAALQMMVVKVHSVIQILLHVNGKLVRVLIHVLLINVAKKIYVRYLVLRIVL